MLSEKEKEELLKLARRTLEVYLKDKEIPTFDLLSGELTKPGGAFVTLHHENTLARVTRSGVAASSGTLRGCIGQFESSDPLHKTVQKMAIAAATEDPRFYPVHLSELPEIQIEISVLSPLETVQRLTDIKVGVHGVCVSEEYHRGVLLPQVATEHCWDRETFLSQTCLKAGLPPDVWEKGSVLIQIFTAEVFREKD